MIVVSSTVKDCLENIYSFVEMNLAAGADVVFIFLDSPNEDAENAFKDIKNVVFFKAYGDYWGESRSENLNVRQKININVANFILIALGVKGKLFHLDSDEVLYFECDKKDLENEEYIMLEPLEVLPTERELPRSSSFMFKRKLEGDKLELLHILGVISSPENKSYFNGHTVGKCGVSPNIKCTLGIHHAKYENEVKPCKSHKVFVLHFDNPSLEGFLKKWLTKGMNDGKSSANVREERKRLFNSVRLIANNNSIDEKTKSALLTKIYTDKYITSGSLAEKLGYLKEIKIEEYGTVRDCMVFDVSRAVDIFNYLGGIDKTAFNSHSPKERARLLEVMQCAST
ncbi:hypothetical protein [Vreelandella populi]|uniref:Glycosyl transferase family 2 n=1 Tax=Vreelandella populi TaxID=2498858 RepID=A0A433LB77_9GAMM|nr:hypothetical protein [Halomonas populi]RUR46006.1 hypothetical protein ELY37_08375 [Halomonas populi]